MGLAWQTECNKGLSWRRTGAGLYSAFYNHIYIYYAKNSLFDDQNITKLSRVLSRDEILKSKKMFDQVRKKTWLCSKIILREILAAHTNISASDIIFTLNPSGKPCIRDSNPDFNLSRTKESFILAINPHGKIGIDMEYLSGNENIDAIIQHAFSEKEGQYCNCIDKSEKFLEIWTAKEAFLKALGLGLTEDLKAIDPGDSHSYLLKNNNFQKKHFYCPSGEKACIVFSSHKNENPDDPYLVLNDLENSRNWIFQSF